MDSDKKIDIYAYAITMYEVLTKLKAWDGCNVDAIKDLVIQGHRPQVPDELVRISSMQGGEALFMLLNIMRSSWSPDPLDRPEFKEIYEKIIHFITHSLMK